MKRKNKIKKIDVALLLFVMFFGIVITVIMQCFIGITVVVGSSMEPTYQSGRIATFDRISGNYEINDVVVFKKHNSNDVLIKRIIAKEGDTVFIENGVVFVNNKQRVELYDFPIKYPGLVAEPQTVPVGCYFVLGDNRNNSIDSRYEEVGFVTAKSIEGKIIK